MKSVDSSLFIILYFTAGLVGSLLNDFQKLSFKVNNVLISIFMLLAIYLFDYATEYCDEGAVKLPYDYHEYFIMGTKRWNIVCISLVLIGFFSVRRFTLTYKHVIKLTPHFGEGISMGLVNMLANFLGAVQVIVFTLCK